LETFFDVFFVSHFKDSLNDGTASLILFFLFYYYSFFRIGYRTHIGSALILGRCITN